MFLRRKYQKGHWDNAIEGYRETERGAWNEANTQTLQRYTEQCFSSDVSLEQTHVLDLAAWGVIKPHVDSIKFCGGLHSAPGMENNHNLTHNECYVYLFYHNLS